MAKGVNSQVIKIIKQNIRKIQKYIYMKVVNILRKNPE